MIKLNLQGFSEAEQLQSMVNVVGHLADDETDPLAIVANAMAVMNVYLKDINWVGIYRLTGNQLKLGPFQGKPACMRIGPGEGVCGATIRERRAYIVPDVLQFDGHIACDTDSRSEITIPIFYSGEILGLIDIDSPVLDRFAPSHLVYFEAISQFLSPYVAALGAL